jgi:predicted GTPase
VGHTTLHPTSYSFVGDFAMLCDNMARLWDLPGAGTKDWPLSSYTRDAGLRHFDGVIFVTSDQFLESEIQLLSQLREFNVPYYIVRNKLDQDIANNAHDNNAAPADTIEEIRRDLVMNSCDASRTFLISAKYPESTDLDFGMLLRAMAMDVSVQRAKAIDGQDTQAQRVYASRSRVFALAPATDDLFDQHELQTPPRRGCQLPRHQSLLQSCSTPPEFKRSVTELRCLEDISRALPHLLEAHAQPHEKVVSRKPEAKKAPHVEWSIVS